MIGIALAVSAILVGIDQLLKFWASTALAGIETMPLIQDVMHFTYHENYGAAFGILQQRKVFLIIFALAIFVFFLYLLLSKKIKRPFMIWTISIILAGGLGNLIDRIFRGYVVDFMDFRLINFPIFNFADCCVVIGVILFAINILFFDEKKPTSKQVVADESVPNEEHRIETQEDGLVEHDNEQVIKQDDKSTPPD